MEIQETLQGIHDWTNGKIVYDISVAHPDGQGNPTPYADLAAALGTGGANIPEAIRKGGMSVKFVHSSDNKYVQYRLTNQSWSINIADWQEIGSAEFSTGEKVCEVGIDDKPTADSENLVKSGGVKTEIDNIEGKLDKCFTVPEKTVINVYEGTAGYVGGGQNVGDTIRINGASGEKYYYRLNVKGLTSVVVTCSGTAYIRPYYIVDKDLKILEMCDVSEETFYRNPISINLPDNAAFVYLNRDGRYNLTGLCWFEIYSSITDDNIAEYLETIVQPFTGENIFDWSSIDRDGAYNSGNGNYSGSSNFKCTTLYTPVKPNSELYFKSNVDTIPNTLSILFYDNSLSFIQSYTISNFNTITTPSDAAYFKLYLTKSWEGKFAISYKELTEYVDYSLHYELKENSVGYNQLELSQRLKINAGYIAGKKIVNFGDSIFGNYKDEHESISDFLNIINDYSCTFYNCAIGGTRMSRRGAGELDPEQTAWDAFSMYSLADAVCANDYSLQDSKVNYDTTLAYVATKALATLKTVDFSNVDLITIAFGTNDYTGGTPIEDSVEGKDYTTYIGAIKYIVSKFQTTYPHIKILFITPIWRHFETKDGSEYNYAGTGVLTDYVNACLNTAKSLRIPVLNSYDNLSLSWDNEAYLMSSDDPFNARVHLSPAGNKMYAELVNGKINCLY